MVAKTRSVWLDNLKGFLIICVVAGHFLENGIDYNSNTCKALFLFIYSFHMPLFIFVSGLLCKHAMQKKEHLHYKIISFAGLFLILKLLIFPFQKLNNPGLRFSLITTDGVPWYLFAMCMFYILAYALQGIDKRKILVVSVCLALFAGYDNGIGDIFVLSRCIVFFPYFVLGWMCDPDMVEGFLHKPILQVLSPVILLTFFIICKQKIDSIYIFRRFFTGRSSYETLLDEQEEIGILFRLLAYMITFIISICILSIIPRRTCFHLDAIGQESLQIYFFHRPVLFLLEYMNMYPYIYLHFRDIANYLWLAASLMLVIILAQPAFSKPFEKYNSFINQKVIKKA